MEITLQHLSSVSKNLNQYGGKAKMTAQLLEMRNQFPVEVYVPVSFGLSSSFFTDVLLDTGLKGTIPVLLADKTLSPEKVSETILETFLGATLSLKLNGPTEFALEAFYTKTLGLAVRSSALGEDSAEAAFAGQHDSILNVCKDEYNSGEVVKAIRQVWASAFNPRAIEYRRSKGLFETPSMGVLIQTMVPNVGFAGVAFSKNPVTGLENVLVEYTGGLGDKLVSGEVIPQSVDLHKDYCKAISWHWSGKLGLVVYRLKELLGYDVDVEWATTKVLSVEDKERLYILQVRPLTT